MFYVGNLVTYRGFGDETLRIKQVYPTLHGYEYKLASLDNTSDPEAFYRESELTLLIVPENLTDEEKEFLRNGKKISAIKSFRDRAPGSYLLDVKNMVEEWEANNWVSDPIYYKIQKTKAGKYNVCCLQWFDEYDYDSSLWVRDEYGEVVTFDSEGGAEMYMQVYLDHPAGAKRALLKKLSSIAGTLDNILDGTTAENQYHTKVSDVANTLDDIITELQEELKNNG